jgi:hypothetical protein
LHHRGDQKGGDIHSPRGDGRALVPLHAVLGGILLHGGPSCVQGVSGGCQGTCLHLLLLCGFAGFHGVRGGVLAGFLGELGDGVAGGVSPY